MRSGLTCVLAVPATLLFLASAQAAEDTAAGGVDVVALATELERLKQRLAELEPLRDQVARLERELEAAQVRQEELALRTMEEPRELAQTHTEPLSESVVEDESIDDSIALGGALRFNFYWNDFDETVESKRGASGLDLFRLNADGQIDQILLSAEYRFYPFMDVLHHGWIGYEFDNESVLEVGVTQVPFGLLPYASHNFWFGTPYYLGLADDYDLGGKWTYPSGPWELQAAFFKNAEYESPTNLDRYSYDVVAVGDSQNEETNQFNLRGSYTFGAGTACNHEAGLSGQYGHLYNFDTGRTGDTWAAAAHLDSRCGRWNVQLEAARYSYAPENPPGVPDDQIRLGGFGTSYDVAADGTALVANLAYNFPVKNEFIDLVTCYNDFSIVLKDEAGSDDSLLNTTGCLVGFGPVYVYLDLIQAENMVFFGDGSLAGDGEEGWFRRFNINIGYYW